MSIEAWLAYVAATAILLVIPGPTILTVIRYSMAQGKRARLPLVATLYAAFAATASSFLASRRAQRGFNLAGGSLLAIAGAWALLAKRATS